MMILGSLESPWREENNGPKLIKRTHHCPPLQLRKRHNNSRSSRQARSSCRVTILQSIFSGTCHTSVAIFFGSDVTLSRGRDRENPVLHKHCEILFSAKA
eukprot:scpid97290/ scgid14709/ 